VLVRKSPTKLDQWKECTFAKNIITAHDGIFINKINVLTRLADQKNVSLSLIDIKTRKSITLANT
jgi:hypothetical protein